MLEKPISSFTISTEVDGYFQAVWHRPGRLDPSFIWTVFIHGLQYSIIENGPRRRAQLDTTVPNPSYAFHGGNSYFFFLLKTNNQSQLGHELSQMWDHTWKTTWLRISYTLENIVCWFGGTNVLFFKVTGQGSICRQHIFKSLNFKDLKEKKNK